MRRFLSTTICGVHNWPLEYRDFSNLLCDHDYNKGSLMSDTLEIALQSSNHQVKPLPPIRESALQYYQKDSLSEVVSEIFMDQQYTILTLFQKCSTLIVNGDIIGSTSSRYKTSSHIMVILPHRSSTQSQNPQLAVIHYYLKIDVVHTSETSNKDTSDSLTIEENSQKKINSIRKFYRDMLYLSKSHSATMVKAALKTNNS